MKVELKDENNIFKKKEIDIPDGLSIVTGCNGAGKSTLLKEVKKYCEDNHIPRIYLDCSDTFTCMDLNRPGMKPYNPAVVLMKSYRSEHEHYEDMFAEWIQRVRPGPDFEGKDFVVLIDGLDSGGDVINFQRHCDLFELMANDALRRGIKYHLLITCNNFHYLSHTNSGQVIYAPALITKPLPAYKPTEYDKYVADITKSAKARKFL